MKVSTKIGVFDSGVGGLTVLAALRKAIPGADFVYLGDTARVPYGPKSQAIVRRYALEAAWFMQSQGAEALVVACNSASAAAADELRRIYAPMPVFDVITPGARAAAAATRNGRIAVLGTRGTVASGAYPAAIAAHSRDIKVVQVACPLFVPLAEEGLAQEEIARTMAARYLADVLSQDCDVILLGCTHYPLLRDVIQQVAGDAVTLVDSAAPLAGDVAESLAVSPGDGSCALFTTDAPDRFIEIGQVFLGNPIPATQQVDLESLVIEQREQSGSDAFLTRGLAA